MTTSQDPKDVAGQSAATTMPSASPTISSGTHQPGTQAPQSRPGQGIKKPVPRPSQARLGLSQTRSDTNIDGIRVRSQQTQTMLPERPSPVPIQSAIPGQPKPMSTQSIPQIQTHSHSRPRLAGTTSSSPVSPSSSHASSPSLSPSPSPAPPVPASAIPPPLVNPLPGIAAPSTPKELSSFILSRPPPLDRMWTYYELTSPKLPKKKYPTIIHRQPVYAREQRELLASMTREGMPHFDLASLHGDDEPEEKEEEEEEGVQLQGPETEPELDVRCRGKGWRSGDVTVTARDGYEIPVRWWERTTRDTTATTTRATRDSDSDSASSSSLSPSSSDSDTNSDTEGPIDGPVLATAQPALSSTASSISSEPETILFYIHGGGLLVGESDSEELSCRRILLSTSRSTLPNLRIYSVGYRLMPQHPASVCLSDTLRAFRVLRSRHRGAKKFLLMGSSSGGELATFVSQIVGPGVVDGVVLRCPVTSDIFSGTSYVPPHLQPYHTSASPAFITCLSGFMRRETPRDGLERMPVEALAVELEGLPRHYIQVTSNDTLYSDGLCYAKALSDAGVEVKYEVEMGWPHTYWLIAPELEESMKADWKCLRGLEWVAEGPSGE